MPNARANISNSIQTTVFNDPTTERLDYTQASVSSDLNWIVVADVTGLGIYDTSTGKRLAHGFQVMDGKPWFTPDKSELWCTFFNRWFRWAIIKDSESDIYKLERREEVVIPARGSYWKSSYDYQVTDDGWILSPSGKELIWLLPHWRFNEYDDRHYIWGGRSLAILFPTQPEPVILELLE